MPATVYTSAVITLNAALYGYAPSNTVFNTEVATAAMGINAYANGKVSSSMSDADLSALVLGNMGLLPNADLNTALTQVFALNSTARGQVILNLASLLSGLTSDATYGVAANTWNAASAQAYAYSSAGVASAVPVPFATTGVTFTQTLSTAAGADVMHLTGDQDVRIDFTNMLKQIRGLDLNGDGTIANDGKENNYPLGANSALTNKPADGKFEIVDAYKRDAFNDFNKAANFLGDIAFDGTGFGGDGVSTNGNIFLGGLGADTASGGNGNDFMAGGGIAQGHGGMDTLYGMRNADFFFAEFSGLDATDGSSLRIDGGISSDEQSAGTVQSAEDSDWLLFEASDDDEPVRIWLNNDNADTEDQRDSTVPTEIGGGILNPTDGIVDGRGRVLSRTGESMVIDDIENIDASGNLYGFLKNLDVQLGGRAGDDRDPAFAAGSANNGQGSSAQLAISGSDVANIIIGGYDNDYIEGRAGDDLLMGGNVKSYLENGTTIAHQLLNPNLLTIPNDGRDELRGDGGDDNIVFEADLGIIDGGADNDTLWITANSLGTSSTDVLNSANTLRFDLKASTLANSAGYGGADVNGTQDQTNYGTAAGTGRVTVTGMESVIATGLGSIDFMASGANSPELLFDNQQNFQRYTGNLDLRGDDARNTLYASDGADVLEGRVGGTVTTNASGAITATGDNRDMLSGGANSDKFIFALAASGGDGVDVIHRQVDANNDNIWDGTFGKDFGEKGAVVNQNSKLTLTLTDSAHPVDLSGFPVNGVAFKLGGVAYTVSLTSGVQGTYSAFNAGLNAALDANPALAALESVLNADNTMTITDPEGKIFEAVGYTFIDNVVPPAGTLTWNQAVGAPSSTQDKDLLIYAAYEDRADGELVDDNAVTGSAISLGLDSYAEDLVADFRNGSTWLAEDQHYTLTFTNLTTEDKVEININSVIYKLTVGVDLDGNEIAGEELVTQGGNAATLADIQTAFLARMAAFITSFMDDDTAAGKVNATSTATTISVNQVAYNGEETVFMRTPTVTLTNDSGGEPAKVSVLNDSAHEVQLLDFDGRNGELNATNVLFIGNQGEANSRSIFATGAGATATANTMTGSEAMVVDGGTNTLQATLYGAATVISDNTATNSFLRTDFTVHGDDQLISGAANDTITAGTGDDRVLGSLGTDSADGGKSYYAVQVLGEAQARVYVMNQWEATNPTLVAAMTAITTAGGVISSINRIGDAETGNATPVSAGLAEVYNDTLEFQQRDFSAGTKFTVTLDTFTGATGATVAFPFAGAGHVMVDDAGNGTTDATTTFTNFENIRTVSGTGNAVANDNQGNDTLNVALLSTATGGVSYDLTNRTLAAPTSTAGDVRYSKVADTGVDGPGETATFKIPDENDFGTLVIKVDGVESVIAGQGNDLLMIDETEAAKNNSFDANLGLDRIEYLDDYNTLGAVATAAAAFMTTAAATADAAGETAFIAAITAAGATAAQIAAANTVTNTAAASSAALTAHADTTTQNNVAEDFSEPIVTIKLDNIAAITSAATGTDTVTMTSGRVGSTVAVDSLTAVERIALNGNTAQGRAEADLLDVTSMTTGAVVDYTNGQVRDLGGVVHVTIENLHQVEKVLADGDDTVIVGDADIMGLNSRNDFLTDNNTPSKDITFSTFTDYDELNTTTNKRVAFTSLAADGVSAGSGAGKIENVINLGQFEFNLGTVGADTVDYSKTVDSIVAVVELDASKPNQYVLVDADGAITSTYQDAQGGENDRVDVLVSVEKIVASQAESVLDLTSSTKGLEIQYGAAAAQTANDLAVDRNTYNVQISDLSSSVPLTRNYVEYRDANLNASTAIPVLANATWNRIEGSDNAEKVIMNSAHSMDTDAFNLRGGANEVKYNELTKSITLTLQVTDFVATAPLTTGIVTGTVRFQDGTGAGVTGPYIGGSGTHTITSYTANNGIAGGSLRVAASQDAEDNLALSGLDEKIFLVSEIGTIDNQITVKLGSGTAQNSVVLTGFELVSDAESNDVYDFGSLVNAAAGLNFVDNVTNDHDTVKVDNGAVGWDGTDAWGAGAVTAGATEISLGAIRDNGALSIAGYDFDVLDVSKVTDLTVTTLTGALASGAEFNTDEVVFGKINNVTSALGFEAVVLTEATIGENGTTYVMNATGDSLTAGAKSVTLTAGVNTLSFGGTVLEQSGVTLRAATALNATSAVTVTTTDTGAEGVNITGGNGNDSLTGAAGADTLRGNSGDDTLNGNFVPEAVEVHTFTLSNPVTNGAGGTLAIGGFTVTEGGSVQGIAVAENDADAVGAAFVRQWGAAPSSFTASASIASLTYDALTNALTFTFTSAAGDVGAAAIGAAVAGGSAATASAEATTVAYAARAESLDTYVFETTAALNGVDTINNFNKTGLATDDVLNVSAFLGVPIGGTVQAANFTAGLDLSAGVANYGVVFNKASLAAGDIAVAAAAGKIAVEDNSKAVVLVSADTDGVIDATVNAYDVYFVQDTDTGTGQTYTVTKVATLNSTSAELSALALDNTTAITGTAAADVLVGTAGADTIVSGEGADTVTGNGGADIITIGADVDNAVDVVVINSALASSADTIGGFQIGEDDLNFSVAGLGLNAADYTAGAVTVVTAAAAALLGAGAWANHIVVDTAAAIAALTIGAGSASGGVLAIASDTGAISFDADGAFGAGVVVIGTVTLGGAFTAADLALIA